MSLVVGDYNEMDDSEPEDIDRFNDDTFGSGAVGKSKDQFLIYSSTGTLYREKSSSCNARR